MLALALPPAPTAAPPPGSAHPPPDAAGSAERQRLLAALDTHRWRRDETAVALGTSRTTLWRKMREHGLLT